MMNFRQESARIDDALASGRLDEQRWYERNREILETAYLASDNPRGQSGFGGDPARWDRLRRVIAEALDRDGTFLDVGCASGLLIESIAAWGAERGLRIEPFGLDISPRLAALAQARLSAWADRIYVGNVIDWEPPRRFDFVRTELVYVPQHRQPELIARLLEQVVAPGGRLVVCAYRSRGEKHAAAIGEDLRSWGLTVAGEATATDLVDGGIGTRVVWLDATADRLGASAALDIIPITGSDAGHPLDLRHLPTTTPFLPPAISPSPCAQGEGSGVRDS
jgi:SAM-dependent methyltransferase